ncbi:MAG: hypothetical protein ACLFNY_06625, partial [Candidatus Aenigmatarchaeota archaeon]
MKSEKQIDPNPLLALLKNPFYRFILSITPAVLAALIFYLLGPEIYLPVLGIFLAFFFAVGAGWIVSPAVGIASGIHPVSLILLLVFISSESSLIVSASYDLLEKVPLLGRLLKAVRRRASNLIENKDLRENVGYLSIFWLMFTPIYGSGPLVMTLVGRLLNLDWRKVWAVIT